MTTVTDRIKVAGIEVSPDHFIGGERVASERRFTDISPIDGEVRSRTPRPSPGSLGGETASRARMAIWMKTRLRVRPSSRPWSST